MEVTKEVLAELRRKTEEATPGPWRAEVLPDTYLDVRYAGGHVLEDPYVMDEEDKAFIAAANPMVMLALLDRIAELDDALWQCQQALIQKP